MSFRVYFQAEQTFLSFVKRTLAEPCTDKDLTVENGAVCVLACTAALEAMVNSLLRNDGRFKHFDELKLASKIETISDFGGKEIDWGAKPWQDIAQLIRLRNWLSHFKDPDIGLINSDGWWIQDSHNKIPKIDPDKDLSAKALKRYYDSTRLGLKELAVCTGLDLTCYEFLNTERYETYLVG
jgi:hypothetical protein